MLMRDTAYVQLTLSNILKIFLMMLIYVLMKHMCDMLCAHIVSIEFVILCAYIVFIELCMLALLHVKVLLALTIVMTMLMRIYIT